MLPLWRLRKLPSLPRRKPRRRQSLKSQGVTKTTPKGVVFFFIGMEFSPSIFCAKCPEKMFYFKTHPVKIVWQKKAWQKNFSGQCPPHLYMGGYSLYRG
jgi:hypothetical protein